MCLNSGLDTKNVWLPENIRKLITCVKFVNGLSTIEVAVLSESKSMLAN
jgi:hypothetical protein